VRYAVTEHELVELRLQQVISLPEPPGKRLRVDVAADLLLSLGPDQGAEGSNVGFQALEVFGCYAVGFQLRQVRPDLVGNGRAAVDGEVVFGPQERCTSTLLFRSCQNDKTGNQRRRPLC
jgi:hypothetical protein